LATPIQEPSQLPGRAVLDQIGRKVGKVKEIYAPGGGDQPMWVTVDVSLGLVGGRAVFIPLARLKDEDGSLQVPYSKQHLHDSPEVDPGDQLSSEDEQRLMEFYSLDRGDQPIDSKPDSYAAQVPDSDEPSEKVDSPDELKPTARADWDAAEEESELSRETRDATPPALKEGPDSPLTKRRRERADELGIPVAGDG
jgi:PRC-barrel domain